MTEPSTALAVVEQPHHNSLESQMSYARAVAVASMLPENYRGKPADIMLAVGLGQSMGLSPAESLYRISVIKGKPTASAELIAANVRKAGHRLRVRGDDQTCTATIIRADDPDYEFSVTRDLAWAQKMGLADQPNYRKQPGTMLQWRAITAVARLACPEALYGVQYAPEEMGDFPDTPAPASGGLAAVITAEHVPDSPAGVEATAGDDGPTSPDVSASDSPAESPDPDAITPAQLKNIGRLCTALGLAERKAALAYVVDVVGREIGSRSDLTRDEASRLIDVMAAEADEIDRAAGQPGA